MKKKRPKPECRICGWLVQHYGDEYCLECEIRGNENKPIKPLRGTGVNRLGHGSQLEIGARSMASEIKRYLVVGSCDFDAPLHEDHTK